MTPGPSRVIDWLWLALCAAWAPCLYRAVLFYAETRAVYRAGGSIAWNDHVYSIEVLVCYATCLAVGVGLLRLLQRMKSFLLVAPVVLCILPALYLIWRAPEEVIVFIMPTSPYYALVISLFAGASGILLAALARGKR